MKRRNHDDTTNTTSSFVIVVTVVVEMSMTQRQVVVSNELGLHARAAARFVHLATQFASQIRIGRDSKMMDGKSIMGILLLAAARGTLLTITAHGPDEAAALDALAGLVESGFGEPSTSLGPGETWNS